MKGFTAIVVAWIVAFAASDAIAARTTVPGNLRLLPGGGRGVRQSRQVRRQVTGLRDARRERAHVVRSDRQPAEQERTWVDGARDLARFGREAAHYAKGTIIVTTFLGTAVTFTAGGAILLYGTAKAASIAESTTRALRQLSFR